MRLAEMDVVRPYQQTENASGSQHAPFNSFVHSSVSSFARNDDRWLFSAQSCSTGRELPSLSVCVKGCVRKRSATAIRIRCNHHHSNRSLRFLPIESIEREREMAHAQVQLICLAPSLVITSVEKTNNQHPFHPFLAAHATGDTTSSTSTSSSSDDTDAAPQPQQHALLIPTLLELLFYSSERHGMDPSAQRFLSYVETQHEISIVFEEQLLTMFPDGALEYEPIRWKALQVASAGTGAFLNQLAVLTELTTQLAKHNVSVFQISTYQTDYGKLASCGSIFHFAIPPPSERCIFSPLHFCRAVLVKIEDLETAITCLESFCYIEMENGDEFRVEPRSSDGGSDHESPTDVSPRASKEDLAVHQHVLSVPDVDLYLVQIDKSCVRRHMYNLIRLLFGNNVSGEGDALSKGKLFLSYSETGDDISVVTYDKVFVEEMQSLASSGDQGVMVSPDSWKVVQVGDTNLGFSETGIVAGQTRVLLSSGTMVFYLSTFATVCCCCLSFISA